MVYQKTNWKYWKYRGNEKEYSEKYLKDWKKKNKTYMRDKMREYRARKTKYMLIDLRIKSMWNPEDTFTQEDLFYIQSVKICENLK